MFDSRSARLNSSNVNLSLFMINYTRGFMKFQFWSTEIGVSLSCLGGGFDTYQFLRFWREEGWLDTLQVCIFVFLFRRPSLMLGF